MSELLFPPDFVWGAATSAYQIEGSPLADGAGPSDWHLFAHSPGNVAGGDTGDIACDHYRHFERDVQLMAELGLQAYRFSISWPRVLPLGVGEINQAGLDFYRRLVDRLLEQNIAPMATLFHWDLPAALASQGGFENNEITAWFSEYTETVARALADRVTYWATINEPWVVADHGYLAGKHPPGKTGGAALPAVSRNLLRAHGAAVTALRQHTRAPVGIAVNLTPQHPASNRDDDIRAAARADAYVNQQFLDPVLLGRVPPLLESMYDEHGVVYTDDDWQLIRQGIDFVGVNYYMRDVVEHAASAWPTQARAVVRGDAPRTDMGWEIYPAGLLEILSAVRARYGDLPLYVTENGAAFAEPDSVDSALDDSRRVEYLQAHLAQAASAIASGVNLRGYFAWSLLDNFEWSFGYSKRFGLVHVDFATGRRTIKSSGRWYARQIASQRSDAS